MVRIAPKKCVFKVKNGSKKRFYGVGGGMGAGRAGVGLALKASKGFS